MNWNKRVRSERMKSHFRGPRFQNFPGKDTPGPPYKCEILCIHQSAQELDPSLIERVQSHKLLGILLQSDLKWHTKDALASSKLLPLNQRRDIYVHCIDLIKNMSSPSHKLHYLLPEKVGNIRNRETRSNRNKFYNFKSRTDRFKNSPLVYAIDKYNNNI